MSIVSLQQKLRRLQVAGFESDNQILFNFFNKLSATERDDALLRALNIGVLALMEDRLSAFLAKTSNELGTELESLKLIFDMKQEVFFKSAMKGVAAEEEIAEFLIAFLNEQGLADTVNMTGAMAGKLKKNKTGDIVCHVDGKDDVRIVIESKFDKGLTLGEIASRDNFKNKTDTAWSQLIEAQANREGRIAIIVFDISSVNNAVLRAVQNVRFIAQIGFIAIIDSQKGDYSNLAIAYMLARDIAVKSHSIEVDKEFLSMFINRLIKDVRDIRNIEALVKSNIENNRNILLQIQKSMLTMDFTMAYLSKFLKDGNLSKEDLLQFYQGDEIRNKFKVIESELKEI